MKSINNKQLEYKKLTKNKKYTQVWSAYNKADETSRSESNFLIFINYVTISTTSEKLINL